MSEKRSGIEMIEELLQRLNMIEKRLDVMDMNIKTIANSARVSELVNKAAGTPLDGWSKAMKPGIPKTEEAGFKNFRFEVSDAAKTKEPQVPARGKGQASKISKILVTGKLKIQKNGKTVPLSGVSVKIYDNKDKLVKSTKTNKAGHWMSHLVPGPYVAEFTGQNLVTQNKTFEVPESLKKGQKEFEII